MFVKIGNGVINTALISAVRVDYEKIEIRFIDGGIISFTRAKLEKEYRKVAEYFLNLADYDVLKKKSEGIERDVGEYLDTLLGKKEKK